MCGGEIAREEGNAEKEKESSECPPLRKARRKKKNKKKKTLLKSPLEKNISSAGGRSFHSQTAASTKETA